MRQQAAVRVDDAIAGRFPAICVKTGRPATGTRRKTFITSSGWTWVLLLWGLFPWFLTRFYSSRTVTVDLPISDGVGGLLTMSGRVEGAWLWLGGVHEDFARALGRQYAHLPKGELP
jgi:hypothetical protein